jgi:hypothetical protein
VTSNLADRMEIVVFALLADHGEMHGEPGSDASVGID